MRGLQNNVDLRESIPPNAARSKLDMEKLALIDITLEDDSLLPSTTTPANKITEPVEGVLPLSSAVVSGKNGMRTKDHESTNSGSMERGEGKVLVGAAVEPNVLRTVSGRNSEMILHDGQLVEQQGSHLNGPIEETLEKLTGTEITVTGLPYLSGKKMRSARVSSNLRKSLAWDKAFSTDEGVLDVDELPLVTKTPRKLRELHPLDIPDILGNASPSPFSIRGKSISNARTVHAERITSSPVQGSINPESHPSDVTNSMTCETSSSKVRSPAITPSQMSRDTKTVKSDSTRPAQIIKADELKGTRLRLPSTFTGKREKSDMSPKPVSILQNNFLRRCKSSSSLLSPSSASSALSKKVSSVSKKVKDTLVKVLPGSFGGSTKNCKANDRGSFHQGSALTTLHTPLGHTLGVIGEDPSSPVPTSVTRSKSSRGFLSGNSLDTHTNIRKKGAQAEISNREVITIDLFGNGTIVPSVKGSIRPKNVGLLGSIIGKAGPLSNKGTEKSSFISKVSPVFCRKKSGPAASQVPSLEKLSPLNAAQRNKGFSSGLRLPSPKIGFFDTTRPSTGDHPSSLPEKILGAASDKLNQMKSRNGLPPKPQHGLPSGRAESTKLARSGIPSAPHLKPFSKLDKDLVASVSAPTSPHGPHHGILSPASHKAVSGSRRSSRKTSNQIHSSMSEVRSQTVGNEPSRTSRKLILESSDCDSEQSLKLAVQSKVYAQPGLMETPSCHFSTGHEADVKSGSLGGDKSPSKAANSSVASSKASVKQPSLGSTQLAGLIEEGVSGCRHLSVVDDVSPGSQVLFGCGVIDSAMSRKEAGNHVDVIDGLTISSGIQPTMETVCNKLSMDNLNSGVCQEFASVGGARLACCPECDIGSGSGIVDRFVGQATCEKIPGPRKSHPEMVSLGFERCLDHGSRLRRDQEIEDSSKLFQGEKLLKDDSSCGTKEAHVLEDSVKVMTFGNKELSTDSSMNIPDVGEEKPFADGNCATEECVTGLNNYSPARHPAKEDAKNKIEPSLEIPSHWSDWPLLGVVCTFSHATSNGKEQTPPMTPPFKRLSDKRTVAVENIQQETPESNIRSVSPVAALDCHSSKHPLAVNVGLLNGIGRRTSTTPLRKDRNLQVVVDHSTSEITSGQENSRVPEGQAGSTFLYKSKQRKSYSTQKLDQAEANGTAEHSFPFSEERLRALEEAGQESLQTKSGAVQHSPPNKISPNRNPWSPVKRNGQQLGPFDCTKKYTNASTGQ